MAGTPAYNKQITCPSHISHQFVDWTRVCVCVCVSVCLSVCHRAVL